MLSEFRQRAYAKVNFGLNVLPRREDGFHNLESIFQTVDLYDELIVRKQESETGHKSEDSRCQVICRDMELPEENTLTKAYEAFFKASGEEPFDIQVELKKGIPSGGGMGGGSSDAAALIRILERMTSKKLSKEQLFQVAAFVGSDVFFFTECFENGTGCALVWGRGEFVQPITGRNDLYLLLVFPKTSSNTKKAYELVDSMLDAECSAKKVNGVKGPSLDQMESIYNESPDKWNLVNTFTPVISDYYPEIARALELVQNAGAMYTEMSGSGSTVFGIFTSEQQAIYSRNLLADEFCCKVVKTICNCSLFS